VGERVERVARLAREIAPAVGADADMAERTARLAKVDLVSETVGEFPELQGVIGRYIAREWGEPEAVADAIEAHYKPVGPSDAVPSAQVSVAVALADKLDMLAGFWAIGEKPTGSKDPYALRRAALGVVRIVLDNRLRLPLREILMVAFDRVMQTLQSMGAQTATELADSTLEKTGRSDVANEVESRLTSRLVPDNLDDPDSLKFVDHPRSADAANAWIEDLLAFFADRLKVHLREQGARHDLIDAVFALPGQDDLLMIVARVEALGRFLETDDGANLLAGVKRAANILRIEEKKDGHTYDGKPQPKLFALDEERALHEAIKSVNRALAKALKAEDFEAAMGEVARLRAPVDAFFEDVTVNADDPRLRENRLKLLAQIRAAAGQIADFSKIEG